MPARKKATIERTRNGYLVTVGDRSKTLPSRSLADARAKIETASKLQHCRYQFNAEERRPFIVAYPNITSDGRAVTKRRKFSTFAAARAFAEERDIATENHGRSFTSELSRDEIAAVTAWRQEVARLREAGVHVPALADTLRQSLALLTTCPDGRQLDHKLLDTFIGHKIDHGIGDRQQDDYRSRLTRFLDDFRGRLAASIAGEEIERWLSTLKDRRNGKRVSAQTRKHYRAALHAFFAWVLPERNPVSRIPAPRVREPERDHYTPAETSKLLEWIRTNDIALLPSAVLGLFCGLRPSEIQRLDLAVIDLSEPDPKNPDTDGEFILRASQTKTGKARAVPLPAAARAWLAAQTLRSGSPIHTERRQHHNRIAAALDSAEVRHVTNGFRHSFATYRGAIIRDSARLADELGNSAIVVARHYRDAKLEAEARAFFAIRPGDQPAEAIPFSASA